MIRKELVVAVLVADQTGVAVHHPTIRAWWRHPK